VKTLSRTTTPDVARQLFGGSPQRTLALLRAAWPLAVGPELARRTEVVALEEGGTLRLRVSDGSWRKTLLKMRGPLLARLRTMTGDLAPSRLSFCDEPLPDRPVTGAAPAQAAAAPEASATLRAAADRIGDGETRDLFLATARRYLARNAS
jgi:hypothetical protein